MLGHSDIRVTRGYTHVSSVLAQDDTATSTTASRWRSVRPARAFGRPGPRLGGGEGFRDCVGGIKHGTQPRDQSRKRSGAGAGWTASAVASRPSSKP
jgi:hypothetical protein